MKSYCSDRKRPWTVSSPIFGSWQVSSKEVRPGCLGLLSVGSEVIQGWKVNHLSQLVPLPLCPYSGKVSPFIQMNLPISICFSSFQLALLWTAWLCLLNDFPIALGSAARSPQGQLCSKLSKPSCPRLLLKGKCSSPSISVTSLVFPSAGHFLSCTEWPKTGHYSRHESSWKSGKLGSLYLYKTKFKNMIELVFWGFIWVRPTLIYRSMNQTLTFYQWFAKKKT